MKDAKDLDISQILTFLNMPHEFISTCCHLRSLLTCSVQVFTDHLNYQHLSIVAYLLFVIVHSWADFVTHSSFWNKLLLFSSFTVFTLLDHTKPLFNSKNSEMHSGFSCFPMLSLSCRLVVLSWFLSFLLFLLSFFCIPSFPILSLFFWKKYSVCQKYPDYGFVT